MKRLHPGQASLWTLSLINVLTVFSWTRSVAAAHEHVTDFAQVLHLAGSREQRCGAAHPLKCETQPGMFLSLLGEVNIQGGSTLPQGLYGTIFFMHFSIAFSQLPSEVCIVNLILHKSKRC